MSSGRSIDGASQRAYRVVKENGSKYEKYKGPYSTLGAAKGMKTRLESYYPGREFYIEQTPEGWERVE